MRSFEKEAAWERPQTLRARDGYCIVVACVHMHHLQEAFVEDAKVLSL